MMPLLLLLLLPVILVGLVAPPLQRRRRPRRASRNMMAHKQLLRSWARRGDFRNTLLTLVLTLLALGELGPSLDTQVVDSKGVIARVVPMLPTLRRLVVAALWRHLFQAPGARVSPTAHHLQSAQLWVWQLHLIRFLVLDHL